MMPGQFLTRVSGRMKSLPGRCRQWGCLLPVGGGSQWGPGPVCMVCSQGLRAVAFPPRAQTEERGK